MPFDALRSVVGSAVSSLSSVSLSETLGSSAPVAIFDSGLGGLSVLRAVRAALPDERLIYVADSLYAPYGERDDDFIADRTLAIGEWLVSQGAKALVVACNTATAQSIAQTRERLAIPVIGVEPGIKPAALTSQTRVVGVLATAVTLRSARFQALARTPCQRLPVHPAAGPRARAGGGTLRRRARLNSLRCCEAICSPCSMPTPTRWCSAARTTLSSMRPSVPYPATGSR